MWGTLRKGFGLVGAKRRRKFALIGLFAVVVSGLEALSAVFVFLLLQLILKPGGIPDLPVIGDPTQLVGGLSYRQAVYWFAGLFAFFYALRSAAFLAQQYAVSRVAEHTGVLLAHRLVDGYLSMPYAFHLQRNSAELVRNAYDNVQQVQNAVFAPVASIFAESVLAVVMFAVLYVASPLATIAVAALMTVTVGLTFRFVQPRLKRLGRQRQQGARGALQHLQQGLGGLRDVKVLARERAFSDSFRRARARMARPQYLRATLSFVPKVTIESVFLGFVLIVLVAAVNRDNVDDVLATLGLFAYAGMRLQPSVQKVAQALNNLRFAEAAVEELVADMALLDVSLADRDLEEEDPDPLPFSDRISFQQVTFRYHAEAPAALAGVDLEIRHGESIGISGHTGGGKTTFLDLLCGLLLPSEGRITVDGVDVAARTRAWQRNIGVVHQNSFLTDDTLRANIAFGLPQQHVDQERLQRAVRMAELEELLADLPEGLDTIVGERGIRLSGGQRQRVTLARALYREPMLLVLDEGTSALDNATEARVIANLECLHGETTLVMVAHRLTTIRRCDRILFFEHGRLAGCGTYDELLATNAAFRTLAV